MSYSWTLLRTTLNVMMFRQPVTGKTDDMGDLYHDDVVGKSNLILYLVLYSKTCHTELF